MVIYCIYWKHSKIAAAAITPSHQPKECILYTNAMIIISSSSSSGTSSSWNSSSRHRRAKAISCQNSTSKTVTAAASSGRQLQLGTPCSQHCWAAPTASLPVRPRTNHAASHSHSNSGSCCSDPCKRILWELHRKKRKGLYVFTGQQQNLANERGAEDTQFAKTPLYSV